VVLEENNGCLYKEKGLSISAQINLHQKVKLCTELSVTSDKLREETRMKRNKERNKERKNSKKAKKKRKKTEKREK
jgi:hypothetical protein